jgi:hypothetical protein
MRSPTIWESNLPGLTFGKMFLQTRGELGRAIHYESGSLLETIGGI